MAAALTLAASSCALFEPIHPELPEIQPVQAVGKGPAVGLRELIDARSSTTIGQVLGQMTQDNRVIVGSEIVTPATSVIANQLANKGYRVVRTPFQAGAELPPKVVVAVLTELDIHRALLDVTVDDVSGHAAFRQTYSGSRPAVGFGEGANFFFSSRFGMADQEAGWALAAINDAAQKMCADPAFIAALK